MSKTHPIFRFSLWTALLGFSSATLIFVGALLYLSPKLPAVEKILEIPLQTPLRVFSEEGRLIAEFGEKKRTPITFDQIPIDFTHAILAAEDSRFYSHPGVDIKGLIRAAVELITTGSIKTGGSTITMQVAKNYFLTRERTFSRKFNEILLALQIERELSKNKILELYVNKIYLGHRSYGIAAASQVYYGKPINELNSAQLAMIAGLPKAPSAYNPVTNPTKALSRRNWILKRMQGLEYITEAELEEFLKHPVTAKLHGVKSETDAPYVAEMVRKEMLSRYNGKAYTEGFRVFTSINSRYQDTANKAVHAGLINYDMRHGYRGPESSSVPNANSTTMVTDMTDDVAADIVIESRLSVLRGFRKVGPLIPAIVIDINKTNATILFADAQQGQLNWEASRWARPFISTNKRGPKPTSFENIIQPGDVIRVLPLPDLSAPGSLTENNDALLPQWQLAQIPQVQSAMISLNPNNGAILALVGGFDFQSSKFNRAIQSGRQAGSNFKPFVYSAALNNGMTAATIINDSPLVFKDQKLESTWRPENSGGKFGGFTRLREALYRSKNLVSIRVLQQTGVRRTIRYVEKFGFNKDKLPNNLSLALGVAELTPLELAQGYTTLANGGYHVEPWFIKRIENNVGETIYLANPLTVCEDCSNTEAENIPSPAELGQEELSFLEPINQDKPLDDNSALTPSLPIEEPAIAERTIEPRIIYIINSMLKDVIKRGTGRKARTLNRSDIGGKTGTTNDQKDAWFSGFNPDIVATVWVGFDSPQTLGKREYGGTAALPIWIDYMRETLKEFPVNEKNQPEGIVTVKIDPETGKRASAAQSNGIFEIFRSEYAPTEETGQETSNMNNEGDLSPEQLF